MVKRGVVEDSIPRKEHRMPNYICTAVKSGLQTQDDASSIG